MKGTDKLQEKMYDLKTIQSKIYEIRGQKVMFDRDLSLLYGVETRTLNQAVKRNIKRFPEDFMFQLTRQEFENLKSQFVISSWGGIRKPPYAFTEQGLAMLSGLLNSDIAIQVNISIMRAFVYIRHALWPTATDKVTQLQIELKELKQYVEKAFTDYNDINEDTRMQLELINQTLSHFPQDGV